MSGRTFDAVVAGAGHNSLWEQAVQWGFIRAALTKLGKWSGDPRWH